MKLKTWLKKTGTPQCELADKAGISEAYITLLKNGERVASPRVAKAIERATKGQVNRLDLLYPD
jgi:DNA-binding transcriptional regulator YdaS (Cro superfamily)